MSREEDFKLLKIKTIILKVNIHCDGCKREVKKLLQRTEGVYTVSIDADQQKVTISGNVHPANLIKRLAKAGKHAELYHPKSSNTTNINNKISSNNKTQALLQGLKAFKDQHNIKLDQSSISKDNEEGSIDSGDNNANKNKNRPRGEKVQDVGDLRGHASTMLANLRRLNNSAQQNNTMRMQQQAMCSRSPQVPQYTTGYYNYCLDPYYTNYCQWTPDVGTYHSDYGEGTGYDDQSISSCSVM